MGFVYYAILDSIRIIIYVIHVILVVQFALIVIIVSIVQQDIIGNLQMEDYVVLAQMDVLHVLRLIQMFFVNLV